MKKVLCLTLLLALLLCGCSQNTPVDPTPVDPTPSDNPIAGKIIEENENYTLWNGTDDIPYVTAAKLEGYEKTTVVDCVDTYGQKMFVHAISFDRFERDGKTVICATWAVNMQENTVGERAAFAFSYDDGKTWTEYTTLPAHDAKFSASHGVVWYYKGVLYAMIPAVRFDLSPWEMKCELYVYNFATKTWEYQNDCCYGFWPTTKPVKLDTGDWIVAGAASPTPTHTGRAKTDGDDFTKWRVKQNGRADSTYRFTEAGMAVNGNMVVIVGRNEKIKSDDSLGIEKVNGRYELAVSVSYDYGDTFTKMDLSGVYSSPTKACCGTLSDGRFYMIFNMDPRNYESRKRLYIGIGDPDTGAMNKLYLLDEYNGALAYPYAFEQDGILYVGYSQTIEIKSNGNQNNIMLVKLPVSALD